VWTETGDILLSNRWDVGGYISQLNRAIRYCLVEWFGAYYKRGDRPQPAADAPITSAPRVWGVPLITLSKIIGYYWAKRNMHTLPPALLKQIHIEVAEWPWRGDNARMVRVVHPCLPNRQMYLVMLSRYLTRWASVEYFRVQSPDEVAACPWWVWDGFYSPIGVLTDEESKALATEKRFAGFAAALPPQVRRWVNDFGTEHRLGGLEPFSVLLYLLPTRKPLRCPELHKDEAEAYLPICATTWRITPCGIAVTGKLTSSPHWLRMGGPPQGYKFCRGQWYYLIPLVGDWWGRNGLMFRQGRFMGKAFPAL